MPLKFIRIELGFVAKVLRRIFFQRALRGAHRYCRAVNPHKIPFFLLGIKFSRRYEALDWREKVVYNAIAQRWSIRRERESRDFVAAKNFPRF
jgi:hypothetical protein